MTTDLAAKPTHVALPVKTETPPARYYKLTQTQRYPSGTVDRAYSQLAGANQVLLDQRVRLAPLQRTVTPNFADAAAPGLRR